MQHQSYRQDKSVSDTPPRLGRHGLGCGLEGQRVEIRIRPARRVDSQSGLRTALCWRIRDTQTKSVKAAGTYTHKSSNGYVLETGVWLTNELVSFNCYGIAPAALRQKGVARNPHPFGPGRLSMSSDPMPTGGLAIFRIRLLPMSGQSKLALLQVNCALEDVPRERSVGGIRLLSERNNSEYSEEISGRVLFLAMRPEIAAPVRTPPQEPVPRSSEAQPSGHQ